MCSKSTDKKSSPSSSDSKTPVQRTYANAKQLGTSGIQKSGSFTSGKPASATPPKKTN